MASRHERLLKLSTGQRRNKKVVPAPQLTRMGPPPSSTVPQPVRVDSTSSSGAASDPDVEEIDASAILTQRKRTRVEGGSNVGEDTGSVQSFAFPPCFEEEGFFERFPPTVVVHEAEAIKRMTKEERKSRLVASVDGLVKMAEMALVLSEDAGDAARVEELEREKAALTASSRKLKVALERSEGMFQEQTVILDAEREALTLEKEKSGRLTEEGELLRTDRDRLAAEVERLGKQVEELNAVQQPAEDEPEDLMALKSRAELIAHIRNLEEDAVGALEDGFNSAVDQLSLLNPGLVTEGIGHTHRVVGGAIIPPPDSPGVDSGDNVEV